MIEAVGFDFDHTLGLDNKLEHEVAVDLGRKLAEIERTEFMDPDGSAFDDFIARYRNGKMSLDAALIDYFETLSRESDSGHAHYADIVAEFKAEALRRAPDFVRPMPGAQSLLADLEAMNVPTAILTNGWSPFQEEKARLIGFTGAVFVSDVIGARKPSPEAFAALEGYFGRPADRIAYVGDDPRVDGAGALAAGMRAIWFDWQGHDYPQGVPEPTYRIVTLTEVVSLLQGPVAEAANPAS
jgi:HAD superfamily hydrolase (TIGR01509 family)